MSCFGFVGASVELSFAFYGLERRMNGNEIIYGQSGRDDKDISLRASCVWLRGF